MISKSFRMQCTIRVLVLGMSMGICAGLFLHTTYVVTSLLLAGFICYQLVALIRYVEQTNRELSRFFHAVQQTDFSQTFISGSQLGPSFDALKQALNHVLEAFRQTRAEKEAHLHYVETVVQHVGSGLIAFRPDGEVSLMNTEAKRLLNMSQLHRIQALTTLSPTLAQTLLQLSPGQRALVKIEEAHEPLQLAIHATAFRLQEQDYTLVSLQNIQLELEDQETIAWQNLIRVLTHEIMNSITSIASLASTAHELLSAQTPQPHHMAIDPEMHRDLLDAVYTMQKRSEGLLHFVEGYRQLSRLPTPQFQRVRISDLFAHLGQLMRPRLQTEDVDFHVVIEPADLELTADPELLEQVLINLLINALEAKGGHPRRQIALDASLTDTGRVTIHVRDNGPGIAAEVLDNIFIPFFTTKPDGSGIGLSLSRQIMRLHRGSIRVHSLPGVETTLTLTF